MRFGRGHGASHARRAHHGGPGGVGGFLKWYTRSRWRLMEAFVDDLAAAPEERDAAALRERLAKDIHHAQRVLLARLVVTVLLALGALTTVAATVANALWFPEIVGEGVDRTVTLLRQVAAIAGSATALLLVLRLAFDRYLSLVDVSATFVAMQLAAADRRERRVRE